MVCGARPVTVTSGYRSPEVNYAVGSSPTSQHITGCAADFRIAGMTPDEIVRTIMDSDIDYDQLIREFDSWVHVSVPTDPDGKPRRQALIIDQGGTTTYA